MNKIEKSMKVVGIIEGNFNGDYRVFGNYDGYADVYRVYIHNKKQKTFRMYELLWDSLDDDFDSIANYITMVYNMEEGLL